jgi:hypothetical protein
MRVKLTLAGHSEVCLSPSVLRLRLMLGRRASGGESVYMSIERPRMQERKIFTASVMPNSSKSMGVRRALLSGFKTMLDRNVIWAMTTPDEGVTSCIRVAPIMSYAGCVIMNVLRVVLNVEKVVTDLVSICIAWNLQRQGILTGQDTSRLTYVGLTTPRCVGCCSEQSGLCRCRSSHSHKCR